MTEPLCVQACTVLLHHMLWDPDKHCCHTAGMLTGTSAICARLAAGRPSKVSAQARCQGMRAHVHKQSLMLKPCPAAPQVQATLPSICVECSDVRLLPCLREMLQLSCPATCGLMSLTAPDDIWPKIITSGVSLYPAPGRKCCQLQLVRQDGQQGLQQAVHFFE